MTTSSTYVQRDDPELRRRRLYDAQVEEVRRLERAGSQGYDVRRDLELARSRLAAFAPGGTVHRRNVGRNRARYGGVLPSRDAYLPLEARGRAPVVVGDLEVYLYHSSRVRGAREPTPAAIAFAGKSNKPIWQFAFRSEAERDAKILASIKARRERARAKTEQRVQRTAPLDRPVQVGDVFYSSYGYDQTNVNFYQVVKLRGATMVDVREIASRVVRESQGSESVVAAPSQFIGPAMSKRVSRGYKGDALIKIASYELAHPWDGAPKHQTAHGYGH